MYELLDARYGDVFALIASVLPPLAWSGYELAKTRRIDAISIIVIASILFTVGATAMGGSARLIQIRDALVTGVVGIIFIFSLALKRPIIFYLARATMARHTQEGAKDFEAVWNQPGVPKILRLLTGIWGIGLIAQTATMCWLAYIWPIGRYLLISPIIGYGIFGLLFTWSLWVLAKNGQAGRAIFQRG